MLSRLWQNAAGGEALSYPKRALFDPIGMTSAVLEPDAHGTFVGSSYLYATARDWARFGQFMLQDGVWNGTEILPAGFVAWMREEAPASKGQYGKGQVWLYGPEGDTPAGQDPDIGFDLPDDTYWFEGHDGQSVAVIPSKKLVVVRMGLTPFKLAYKPQGLVSALAKAVIDDVWMTVAPPLIPLPGPSPRKNGEKPASTAGSKPVTLMLAKPCGVNFSVFTGRSAAADGAARR